MITSLILYGMRPDADELERRMSVNVLERLNLEVPPGGVFESEQNPPGLGSGDITIFILFDR